MVVGATGTGGLDPVTLMMAIFFAMVAAMLQPMTMMALYITDRQFFVVDLSDNLYSPLAYYVAHSILGLPAVAIPAQVRPDSHYHFTASSAQLIPFEEKIIIIACWG